MQMHILTPYVVLVEVAMLTNLHVMMVDVFPHLFFVMAYRIVQMEVMNTIVEIMAVILISFLVLMVDASPIMRNVMDTLIVRTEVMKPIAVMLVQIPAHMITTKFTTLTLLTSITLIVEYSHVDLAQRVFVLVSLVVGVLMNVMEVELVMLSMVGYLLALRVICMTALMLEIAVQLTGLEMDTVIVQIQDVT